MRSLPLLGLGAGFVIIGFGLFLITLIKSKPSSANPKKAEQRELEVQREDTKKLRLASIGVVAFGVVLLLMS